MLPLLSCVTWGGHLPFLRLIFLSYKNEYNNSYLIGTGIDALMPVENLLISTVPGVWYMLHACQVCHSYYL